MSTKKRHRLKKSCTPAICWNGDREYNRRSFLSTKEIAKIDWGEYLPWTVVGKIISDHFGLPLDNVVVGCRIEMFLAVMASMARLHWSKPTIGTLSPSFALAFDRLAQAYALPILYSFLPENFKTDAHTMLHDFVDMEGMVWLCNPNNPTGSVLQTEEIVHLARSKPDNLVVVDEAYIDNAPGLSMVPFLESVSNLVVLRSLSKGPGIASAWNGYALFGCASWAARARGVVGEYISSLGSMFLRAVLKRPFILRDNIKYRMREKERIKADLEQLGISFTPTVTSFLLGRMPQDCTPHEIYEEIRSEGVQLSTFEGVFRAPPGWQHSALHDMFRITPVDARTNTQGLRAMRQVLGNP